MSITLTTAEITKLKHLHGEVALKQATNPQATASAIDEDVLATGVEAMIAKFARRGYDFGQSSIEVLTFAILTITPMLNRPPELDKLEDMWDRDYPFRWPSGAATVAETEGTDVNDHKAFTTDNLNALDRIRSRPGHDQPRGNV